MTSSWTVRILAGLLAISLVVLGVNLISGGDDDGGEAAVGSLASNGEGDSTAESEGDRTADEQGGTSADVEDEIRRLQDERTKEGEMTEDEKEAQRRAQRFYEILAAVKVKKNSAEFDSAGFCDLMSKDARKQTITYAKQSSGVDKEWNCENSVELLVIRSKRTGGLKQTRNAKVVAAKVDGDRATATVRFGKGPLSSIPLVKEDGEWKLGSSTDAGESAEND